LKESKLMWRHPRSNVLLWSTRYMVWTYIYQYFARVLGIRNAEAVIFGYRLCGFSCRRWIAHFLLRFHPAQAKLLKLFLNFWQFCLLLGHLLPGMTGLYSLSGDLILPCRWCSPPFMGSRFEELGEGSKICSSLSRHGPSGGEANHADLTRNDPRSWRFQLWTIFQNSRRSKVNIFINFAY